jgi:hypothetical protein
MQNPAAVQGAELARGHTEVDRVVRQEMAGRRLKNCEGPEPDEKDSREDEQRPAIVNKRLQKAALVVCQKMSLIRTDS